jgi:hypothetical protein
MNMAMNPYEPPQAEKKRDDTSGGIVYRISVIILVVYVTLMLGGVVLNLLGIRLDR